MLKQIKLEASFCLDLDTNFSKEKFTQPDRKPHNAEPRAPQKSMFNGVQRARPRPLAVWPWEGKPMIIHVPAP